MELNLFFSFNLTKVNVSEMLFKVSDWGPAGLLAMADVPYASLGFLEGLNQPGCKRNANLSYSA